MKELKHIKLVPFLIVFYEIALFLSNDMYLPSMPAIAYDLNLTQDQVQSTLTVWFLGAGCLQLILGPISDRFGRKNVLLFGAMMFVVSSAACAMATTLDVMLWARFFQGTALGSLVAAYAAIHELYSTKRAIKIIALMGAISILAPAFGPLFGAMLVQFATWHYIFWLFVVMGIISVVLLAIFLPESNSQKHSMHLKVVSRDFINIFVNKNFILPNLSYCCLVAVFFFWMFESPFIIIQLYQKSTLYYGIAQAVIFSCFFVGAELVKVLLRKHTVRNLIRISMLIAIIGSMLFLCAATYWPSMLVAIVAMMVISLGTSMVFGPINRVAIEACSQPMGRRTAVFSTTISLAGAACGWILSLIQTKTLLSVGILIVISMLFATLLLLPVNYSKIDMSED